MIAQFSTVLIVDDNSLLLSILSEILKECGFTTYTANNGFEALAEIARRAPDLILSDLNMPSMSGYELLSIIRRRFPGIVVIAMSGSYSGSEVPTGVAADAFYAKGASSIAQLLDMVCSIKEKHELLASRTPAPVWVPELLHNGSEDNLLITCPECLRPSLHLYDRTGNLLHSRACPHCFEFLDLAIVRTTIQTDATLPSTRAFTGERLSFASMN